MTHNGPENNNEPEEDIFEDKEDFPLASQFPEWDLLPPALFVRRKP